MAGYLERYRAGECEQVWAELVALRTEVRQEPILSEARAVADETMNRVRANVETLIERLKAMEFDFVSPADQIIRLSDADGLAALDEFEQKVGAVPLSIRAWCEKVGSVDFRGTYPLLSYYHLPVIDPAVGNVLETGRVEKSDLRSLLGKMVMAPGMGTVDDARLGKLQGQLNEMLSSMMGALASSPNISQPGTDEFKKRIRAESSRKPVYTIAHEDIVMSDPLYFDLGEISVETYQDWLDAQENGEIDDDEPFSVMIAPDVLHKSNYSGSDGDQILLPDAAADAALVNGDHEMTFVEYLRFSLRWGGFSGLAEHERRPSDVLAHLTEGLLPI